MTKNWLLSSIFFLFGYAAWTLCFRLVTLTLVTYSLVASTDGVKPKLSELSDAFSSTEIFIVGIGSLLFTLTLRHWKAGAVPPNDGFFSPKQLGALLIPGFFRGGILATELVIVFLFVGVYRYIGILFGIDEAPLVLLGFLIRVIGLTLMAYCEEYLFRERLLRNLEAHLPAPIAAIAVSLAYCGIKAIQFDPGILQSATLFLLSLSLCARTKTHGGFTFGAGFWTGLLVVFHALLGLPVLGVEYSGILLIEHEWLRNTSNPSFFIAVLDPQSARFFIGGAGGPLSSLILQMWFCAQILISIYRRVRTGVELVAPSR